LLLAVVGIYGVLSYSVRRRVREIGIRVALGARLGDVLRMVVLEGMKPTLLGVGIGIIAALGLGRTVSSLIYGVRPSDPLTLVLVALLLSFVAFLASLIPAYRATKVDPMVALRYE
jgi:putative ABC transport system permease protein